MKRAFALLIVTAAFAPGTFAQRPANPRSPAVVAAESVAAAPDNSNVAVLRSGDTIEIRVGGVPAEYVADISAQYQVDDQGQISLPLIPPVKVQGLTVGQAQTALEQKLRSEEIFTHPTIIITTQATMRFVSVGGSVRAPGRIPFTNDLTLMSAINAAGGVTEFADPKKVSLIRGGKRMLYNLQKLRKDPLQDPKILPGDQIEIPQSWW
jgi:polysaccharide export outer membrane protein